jgi:CheY-like chemotaxis protein
MRPIENKTPAPKLPHYQPVLPVDPVASKEPLMKAILFVDDHEVLARLSCEILEMQGYRVVSAYSGEEALRKFAQERFDMLVTDYRMLGMNGAELAGKVREKRPEMPVVLVTGYGPLDENSGKDVSACLQKEDLFPALLDTIKLLLGEDKTELKPQVVKSA